MRMWLINPEILCTNHLLGEHNELHMLVGAIQKGKSIQGFKDLVQTKEINSRHEQLVNELIRRHFIHNSPLEYKDELNFGTVDKETSLIELLARCPKCYYRYVYGE